MSSVAPNTAPLSLGPKIATDREKLSAAAKQFEAIFVRQMFASARATDFGGKGVFGEMDQTFIQMRDDRFAQIASETGALGLAGQIERHLAKLLPPGAAKSAGGK